MCLESSYCTLAEYMICHAAFAGCHLTERLQCSRKPLPDVNDSISVGLCCAGRLLGSLGGGARVSLASYRTVSLPLKPP